MEKKQAVPSLFALRGLEPKLCFSYHHSFCFMIVTPVFFLPPPLLPSKIRDDEADGSKDRFRCRHEFWSYLIMIVYDFWLFLDREAYRLLMRSGLRLSAPCRSKDGEEISGLLLPRWGSACSPMAVESVLVLTSSRCWGINTNYQTLRYFTTVNEPPTVVFTITDAHELHVIRNPWFFWDLFAATCHSWKQSSWDLHEVHFRGCWATPGPQRNAWTNCWETRSPEISASLDMARL